MKCFAIVHVYSLDFVNLSNDLKAFLRLPSIALHVVVVAAVAVVVDIVVDAVVVADSTKSGSERCDNIDFSPYYISRNSNVFLITWIKLKFQDVNSFQKYWH